MSKKKITKNDREKLFDRVISKGNNKGDGLGQTIGHAFAYSGGYLTGSDIITLSNTSNFEELTRMGFIERYEKLNELSAAEKEKMTAQELKQFDRENTVYIATTKLTNFYRDKIDADARFAKGNSVKHALIQRAVYMSASREIRQTFLNEKDLEAMYQNRMSELKEISQNIDIRQEERLEALNRLSDMKTLRQNGDIQLVDFAYKNDSGELFFGEAITENYTSRDKDAKGAFVKALGHNSSKLTFYK